MLGGLYEGHRDLCDEGTYGAFEQAIDATIGQRVRGDKASADELWGALANIVWIGPNGEDVAYSWRAAGDLCAALRKDEGTMTYMLYYMAARGGYVADWIEEAMAGAGWHPMSWDEFERTRPSAPSPEERANG